MRGIAALSPARNTFKQIHRLKGAWRTLANSSPKKQGNQVLEEEMPITNDKTDPIVAFSKPPPQPPFFGPLVVFSLLESWSSRGSDDD